MTDKLVFDLDDLTFGEMELIEERCGKTVAEVFNGNLSATAMRACAWVALRRQDPDAKWEDTAGMSVGQFDLAGGGDVPPTDASG